MHIARRERSVSKSTKPTWGKKNTGNGKKPGWPSRIHVRMNVILDAKSSTQLPRGFSDAKPTAPQLSGTWLVRNEP